MKLDKLINNLEQYRNKKTGKFDLIPDEKELQEMFKYLKEYQNLKEKNENN